MSVIYLKMLRKNFNFQIFKNPNFQFQIFNPLIYFNKIKNQIKNIVQNIPHYIGYKLNVRSLFISSTLVWRESIHVGGTDKIVGHRFQSRKKNENQFTKLPSSVGWGVGLFLLLFSHFSLSPSIFSFPFTRFFRCVLNLSMVRGARVPVPCIVFPYTWLPWKKSRRDRHSWIRQDTGTFCSSTPFVSTSAQREVLK